MIFTIDRLQFINNKLIAFEFFNIDIEKCNEQFINDKVKVLRSLVGTKIDSFYYIKYKDDYSYFEIENAEQIAKFSYEEFSRWFRELNGQVTTNRSSSKPAGSVRGENIDVYVAELLNTYYQLHYSGIDFFVDDNGLKLVKTILNEHNESTFGFDFDLYCSMTGTIFEFLKRDNEYVTNLTAHPARYFWNKQKFVSLWKATKRIDSENKLVLVNYSDNILEPVGLIVIQDFDITSNLKMSLNDIGYNIGGKSNIIKLLESLENGKHEANEFLKKMPKEVRNHAFFNEVYDEVYFKNIQEKKGKGRWNCSKIGKNYI
ncbi:TPA: hypothetical protein ACGOYS_000813 [Streptococcus suis]